MLEAERRKRSGRQRDGAYRSEGRLVQELAETNPLRRRLTADSCPERHLVPLLLAPRLGGACLPVASEARIRPEALDVAR